MFGGGPRTSGGGLCTSGGGLRISGGGLRMPGGGGWWKSLGVALGAPCAA